MKDSTKNCGNNDCSCKSSSSSEKKISDQNILTAQENPTNQIEDNKKPDPTRFGDWEIGGRAIDF